MDSAQLGSVYYASSSLSFAPPLLLLQLGMQFLFIYFEATLMVSWLYKAAFLSPSLSLSLWVSSWSSIGFCRVHLTHHIWFALVKFLCVLWTPFWLCYLWPCQAVAQLVKSCYPSPPPFFSVCFLWPSEFGGCCIWHAVAMRAPKKFSL